MSSERRQADSSSESLDPPGKKRAEAAVAGFPGDTLVPEGLLDASALGGTRKLPRCLQEVVF